MKKKTLEKKNRYQTMDNLLKNFELYWVLFWHFIEFYLKQDLPRNVINISKSTAY